MMEVIEDLPADVVGIAARGKIVKEDYENLIIPVIEQRIAEHGKIKMLFELHHFDGMELAAMWQDTKFGMQHWHDFTHLALVTDDPWLRNMTAFFAHMIPAEVRCFGSTEAEAAREWLVTTEG